MSADQVHSATAKSYLRVLLHSEKVAASQMCIPVWFACPKCRSVNYHLDRRRLRVRCIKFEAAVDILEVAADVGHHHVPRAKFCSSVAWLESPSRHVRSSFNSYHSTFSAFQTGHRRFPSLLLWFQDVRVVLRNFSVEGTASQDNSNVLKPKIGRAHV